MTFKLSLYIEKELFCLLHVLQIFFPAYSLSLDFDGVVDYTEEISLIKSFIIIVYLLTFHAAYSPALTIF